MEHEEKILNPQESLRVIRETIDLAKNKLRNNGFHFLLWGWLVVCVSILDYYLTKMSIGGQPHLAWMFMPVIGVPVALIYEWRRGKKDTQPNLLRDWYGFIWLGFAISLIITILLAVRANISPVPFILILVGFATFMSGILLRFNPLIFGAVVMWAGAVVCMVLGSDEHVLVQGVATAVGYLIPGYWLNHQSRNHHV